MHNGFLESLSVDPPVFLMEDLMTGGYSGRALHRSKFRGRQ